jgi:hypothetical protein
VPGHTGSLSAHVLPFPHTPAQLALTAFYFLTAPDPFGGNTASACSFPVRMCALVKCPWYKETSSQAVQGSADGNSINAASIFAVLLGLLTENCCRNSGQ